MSQRDRWLHAGKLFASAMLAFWLSVRIGLPQTYWAMVTCCVVANANSAAVLSKAAYRIAGTCSGGVVALLIASAFGSVPLLMIVVAGPVTALGFVGGTLDRTPRSYGFMLFSITLLLVLIGGINSPQTLFDTAWARICEISLGIACVAVVDSVVAPRSLASQVRARLRRWLPDMQQWIDGTLEQRGSTGNTNTQSRIIADIAGLSALSGQLRYDAGVSRYDRQIFFAMQRRLLRLVPLLSTIDALIPALSPRQRLALTPLLARVADGGAIGPGDEEPTDAWHTVLHRGLLDLVAQATTSWDELRRLDARLEGGPVLEPDLARRVDAGRALPLTPDWNTSLRIGAGVLLAYSLIAVGWQATGWAQGANALIFGLVALGFFGGVDQADRAIASFGRFAAMAGCAGALLSYVLLPLAHDFPTFAIAIAIVVLPLAAWGASNAMATLLLALGLSTINLQGSFSPPDFGSFIESNVATLCGVAVAFFCVGTVRRMGPAHVITRLARAQRNDIIALSRQATAHDRDGYLDRSLDRIAMAAARFPPGEAHSESASWLVLLRTGAHVLDIRLALETLDDQVRRAGEGLLATVRGDVASSTASAQLLVAIDHTLDVAFDASHRARTSVLVDSLVGLRLAAFPRAPRWEPVS